jgi:hypothetical protein
LHDENELQGTGRSKNWIVGWYGGGYG